jgi:hypothetical protein
VWITVPKEHRFGPPSSRAVALHRLTRAIKGGLTHGFVVEFASKEDRDYYVSEDPVHQAFVKKHRQSFDDLRVIDYEKGVY